MVVVRLVREPRGSGTVSRRIFPAPTGEPSTLGQFEVARSDEKTAVLEGAWLDVLALKDRRHLIQLSGANSLPDDARHPRRQLGPWTVNQVVEVMIKLADSNDGTMRWSMRCAASSGDYTSATAADPSGGAVRGRTR